MSSPASRTDPLSLDEMLRVMDVATELRKQRETVEKELAIDETKRMLRERLLQTTVITGERVSEAEVDTAITQYFDTLHTYREPTGTWEITMAHLYVRRGQLSITLMLLLGMAGVSWYMLHTSAGMFSRTVRSQRQTVQQATSTSEHSARPQAGAKTQSDKPAAAVSDMTSAADDPARAEAAAKVRADELAATVNEMMDRVRAVAREASVSQELDALTRELDVAQRQLDVKSLAELNQRTQTLLDQLNQAYEVHIVSKPNEKSGIDRYFQDADGKRVSGYYVIVEARHADGTLIARPIRNSETSQTERVTRWAERVPKEVYDRIREDKKSDGVLNETFFAVKQRGHPAEEIRLPDSDGKPLSRQGQITKW